MLRSEASYPYPVLRSQSGDYKTSVFINEINILQPSAESYQVKLHLGTDNKTVSELIKSGKAGYALYKTCTTTFYREMQIVSSDETISIPFSEVHKRVDLQPFIIALQDIPGFSDGDVDDDYFIDGDTIDIHCGDVLGVGDSKYFSAIYKNDFIAEGSSIVSVQGYKGKYMKVDLTQPHIFVSLPEKMMDSYLNLARDATKTPMIHATIFVPAIVQAVMKISELENTKEEDLSEADKDMQTQAWYLTLKKRMDILAESENKDPSILYESAVETVEKLLENNLGKVLPGLD